jgi:hypothetical protein
VILRSPFDLKPVWDKSPGPNYALLLDGRYENKAHMVTEWNYRDDMTELRFVIRGRGGPLKLGLATDLSADIPAATVKIMRVPVPQPPPAPPAPAPPPLPSTVPAEPTPAGDVVARASFPLPVRGGPGVQTDLPLQNGRLYHLRIHTSSSSDLRRLWSSSTEAVISPNKLYLIAKEELLALL